MNDATHPSITPGTYRTRLAVLTSDPYNPAVYIQWTMRVTAVIVFPESIQADLQPAQVLEALPLICPAAVTNSPSLKTTQSCW